MADMSIKGIDTNHDFTMDTACYWNGFWEREDGRGVGGCDPDSSSPILRAYHRKLWSRTLPNGESMELMEGTPYEYLTWNGMRFGSDSILASFRYRRYKPMLDQVAAIIPDYRKFVENFLHKSYTIGGMMIFPKRKMGINQARGCNPFIRDRWDLTMECISRHYNHEDNPLENTLKEDDNFFYLFNDFKGFVDFFFLQDCVSEDYNSVIFWEGDGEFRKQPLPRTPEEYIKYIEAELDFVAKRNGRIASYIVNR